MLLIGLILIITYYASTLINSISENEKHIAHTHEVLSQITNIQKLILDLETGERGFLIVGEDKFL